MSSTDTEESEENYTSRNMSINIAQGAKQQPANMLLPSANKKEKIGRRSKVGNLLRGGSRVARWATFGRRSRVGSLLMP